MQTNLNNTVEIVLNPLQGSLQPPRLIRQTGRIDPNEVEDNANNLYNLSRLERQARIVNSRNVMQQLREFLNSNDANNWTSQLRQVNANPHLE